MKGNRDTVIRAADLSKVYKLYDKPKDRFKETFHPLRKKYHHEFFALKDVSFEIKRGDTVGIIGRNGAGKSTLLQMINGIVTPSSGGLEVNGKISALLELGSGFNPEFTGIDNIYFYGSVMGYTKSEIDDKIDDILSFADIGEFVNQPMKMYSTGMFVRLAFSVATMIDPDILMVDEALSVGDIFFQAKCINRMKKMIEHDNVTLLFVSHDILSVKSLCNKCFLLDNGILIENGKSSVVTETFFRMKLEEDQQNLSERMKEHTHSEKTARDKKETTPSAFVDTASFQNRAQFERTQNGKANLVNIQLLDEDENEVFFIRYEQNLILRMAIEIQEDIHTLIYGYSIRNEGAIDVVHSDSVLENKSLHDVKKGERYIVDWKFSMSLTDHHGKYSVAAGLVIPINYKKLQLEICDRVPVAVQFTMQPRPRFPLLGLVHWNNEINITKL